MDVKYTPRWLHKTVTIPASGITKISPTSFKNLEVWPWQLHWLSLTGTVAVEAQSGDYCFNRVSGGVARRLTWEIGITGEGDINLVEDMTDCIMGINERVPQYHDLDDSAFRFRFPVPFSLAPDSGVVAQVRNNYLNTNITTWDYPGIVLNGYQKRERVGKTPAQLAGHGPQSMAYGFTHLIDSADMMNNGLDPLFLTEMLITPGQIATDKTEDDPITVYTPEANQLLWRVNPSTGVPWMPRAEPIPAGNIAPFNRGIVDIYDEAPRAMRFPQGTIMKPRQALGMKIRNLSSMAQEIDICLFGLLEVS